MTLRLSKHHGLGNDFLVLIGPADRLADVDADLAVRLCDRHRGVGADGLLVGVLPAAGDDADLTMTLFNADGGVAEMSGNGIRCLAQAEAQRRGTDHVDLRIATGGGPRPVQVRPGPAGDPATVLVRVEMGSARPGPEADWQPAEPPAAAALKAATVDLGNPHLVLLVDDATAVPLDQDGPLHESCYDAGINVHVVSRPAGDGSEAFMRTWERGVGLTEACGTGATAVAHALHDWGLVGDTITVHMPGGDAEVEVGEPMVLTGPATFVADVEVTA
jgi:diaminopimelate epimerase